MESLSIQPVPISIRNEPNKPSYDSMKSIIFISSVQKEFQAERRAIADFVRGDPLMLRYFDLFLFEDLPRPIATRRTCTSTKLTAPRFMSDCSATITDRRMSRGCPPPRRSSPVPRRRADTGSSSSKTATMPPGTPKCSL